MKTLEKIIKHIDLTEPKTVSEITDEIFRTYHIDVTERQWREAVEKYNRNHFIAKGGRGLYIAGTRHGYVKTYRKKFIQENVNRKIKTAIATLKQCRDIQYALGNRENQRLFEALKDEE